MPYTLGAHAECSRFSNVIEKITNDVTKALERNLGEIIENEKNVNNCLMSIPQIKNIFEENDKLITNNKTLQLINKQMQEKITSQGKFIGQLQRKVKELIEQGSMRINTEMPVEVLESINNNRIIQKQKELLFTLRKQVSVLQEENKVQMISIQAMTSDIQTDNISLEVEEYDTKNNNSTDSESAGQDFYSVGENQILVSHIQLDTNNVDELLVETSNDSEEDSEDDSDSEDDTLILAHWKKEKEKLDKLNDFVNINLEMEEDIPDTESKISVGGTLEVEEEEEEEEEEEVEEYELMITGIVYKVYRSNTGNIYEILEDEEAGELMGTINDTGEFISL
jgi:hypothetical protein